MKTFKKIILLTVLVLYTTVLFSQWKSLNPVPTGSNLSAVWMLSETDIVVGGDNGLILKSSDGGTNWKIINSKTNKNINDIYFSDSRNGWAVGAEGTIINTTDGGTTWNIQTSGEIVDFYDVNFASTTVGVVVGDEGAVMKTVDGGATWERKTISTTEALTAIDFLDANTAVLVGSSGKIFKSVNAGNSWSVRTSGIAANLYDVDFVDANTGWAVGESTPILKTVDGGTTWSALANTSDTYEKIRMINGTTGYLVGSRGIVKKTTDGGTTWNQVLTLNANPDAHDPLRNGYSSIYLLNDQKGIAVGDKGSMIKTTNGGGSFTNLNVSATVDTFTKVYFISKDTGFLFGDKSFYKSFNAGVSWTKVFAFTNYNAPSIKFFDSKNGVAIRGDQAYKTTDGGNTWTKDASVKLDGVIISQTKAVRLNGSKPQYTTNGGTNWNDGTLDSYYDYFNDLVMVNENIGYVTANYDNKIVKTTDGGKTWTGTAGSISWPNRLFFVDESTGWVSGSNGLFKTTDGGTTFVQQHSNTHIKDIKFISSSEGYFSTEYGDIFKTTDGGTTWTSQISSTSQEISSLFILDKTHGWAVGKFGTILSMDVTKPILTVTTVNKTRKYGENNPALTFTYAGFIDGDTKANITEPTISCTATKTTDAGTYPIILAGGASSKYSINLVNGVLTIDKATLTITADNKSRKLNDSNPVFTYTYSGFLNGDTEGVLDTKPTISCSATADSPVGEYDIIVSGASDNNYSFNYTNGKLTVAKYLSCNSISNSAKIYPTVVKDIVNVNLEGSQNFDISLYSIIGTLVFEKHISSNYAKLNLSELSKGIYLISVTANNYSYSTKIIKE